MVYPSVEVFVLRLGIFFKKRCCRSNKENGFDAEINGAFACVTQEIKCNSRNSLFWLQHLVIQRGNYVFSKIPLDKY